MAVGLRELNTKFKVVKLVGKGSYGSVYQVQRLGDGKTYALKEMDIRTMSQAEREDSINEVRLLASIQHPNVISYNEAFIDGNRLCIIMEYAPDGDLCKVIKKYTLAKARMPEEQIWKYFIQIARGLANLHNMKIIHRDIKPGNIMVLANDVCKIGDLGIAKLLRHTMAKTQIGTPHYMPPEIWRNKAYGFTSDSWAMGCILFEMASNSVPFEARSMNELKSKVLRGSYPKLPSNYSKDLVDMVARCLDQNPDKRPTMNDILNSPAVASRMYLVGHMEQAPMSKPQSARSEILDTIKVPRNIQMLKGKLPAPVYASDQQHRFSVVSKDAGECASHANNDRLPSIAVATAQQPAARLPPVAPQHAPQRSPMPKPLMPHRLPQGFHKPSAIQPPVSEHHYNMAQGRPSPSAYEALRKVQAQAMYVARNPLHAPKAANVSESHAAYGAFYYSPKAAPPLYKKNAPWADMYGQAAAGGKQPPQVQQQQQQQQQVQQRAYAGYYAPYSAGGNPRAAQGPPAKLPSIAQRQQQREGSPQQPPAWNAGGGGGRR